MHPHPASPSDRPDSAAAAPGRRRVAVVAASWHADIVGAGTGAMRDAFVRLGVARDAVAWHTVPGAFEIPLHALRLARSGRVDAVVACALVVNGGIYRHEFVAASVVDALMRVQLDTGVPVLSMVLTPRDFHDHDDHRAFFRAHFVRKGEEAAQACVAVLDALAVVDAAAAADVADGTA